MEDVGVEKEKNIIIMADKYIKENIQMVKEMEKDKNLMNIKV